MPRRLASWLPVRSSITWLVVSSYLQMVVLLPSSIVLARALGPVRRGELAIVTLVDTLTTELFVLGVPYAVGYFYGRRRTYVGSALIPITFVVAVLSALATLLASFTFFASLDGWDRFFALAVIGSTPISFLGIVGRYVTIADRDYLPAAAFQLVPAIVQLVAITGTVSLTGSLNLSVAIGSLVVTRVALAVYLAVPMFLRAVDREPVRAFELLRYGLRTMPAAVGAFLMRRMDLAVVAIQVSQGFVGIYAVSLTVGTLGYPLTVALATGIFRSTVAAGRGELETPFAEARRSIALSLVVAIASAVCAPILIPVAFGSNYRPAVAPAVILCLMAPTYAIYSTMRSIANGIGKPGIASAAQLFSVVVFGASLVILVPRFDLVGAALANVIAGSLRVALTHRFARAAGIPIPIPRFEDWRLLIGRTGRLFGRAAAHPWQDDFGPHVREVEIDGDQRP